MSEIEKLDKQKLVQLAKGMRNRARNMALDKQRMASRVTNVAVGAGASFVVGYFMGGKEAEYLTVAAEVEAGTAEDPRKVMGIDIDLLLGLGVSGLGVTGLAGKKASDLCEAAGTGILAGYAYARGSQAGLESAQEA
jgi:hypothetical protein